MSTALDVLGQEVVAGDRIAAAFSLLNTVSIRVGTVVGFAKRNSSYGNPVDVMEVAWEVESGFGGSIRLAVKQSRIEIDLRRFVKLG